MEELVGMLGGTSESCTWEVLNFQQW